jgi:hypothetical protein
VLKLNPERAVEIPEQNFYCSEFHSGFNGAKTGFLSPTVREIFVKENGKIGKLRIRPLRVHRFSRSTGRIKKTNCKKKFLYWNPKGFFFKLIIGRDMNDLVRYPFGTISKSFYSVLPFCLFMSFATPSHIFVFLFSPFFALYMY